ncbi:FAST kinase domain-containing protein 2, mitochondrial [Acipenser oxyrinchus oxyrinchus]|uniref:FAST kinase domain-containing protein 2, mitochondrial n=1 Tax=Acipenser oxyrinchus oxyrinchus TaxID=40147 RepID=A0AAD8DAI9_ACIOX|nr:FAST kinase domain-containing protein 2, mitochondrial [Acipenser oxyrinchus oxyrinchus]
MITLQISKSHWTKTENLSCSPRVRKISKLKISKVSAFCLGTNHPKGKLAMKMWRLTALGYSIVLAPAQEFEKLQEDEQVQFLKTKTCIVCYQSGNLNKKLTV